MGEREIYEIIEWLINDASLQEIDGIHQFLIDEEWVNGLTKFFTRKEFRQFKEEINKVDETYIWEEEDE